MWRMKDKKTLKIYLATGLFLLFGLACIVCGYGFADGWDKVLGWFTSRWAVYVYVFLGLYAFGVAFIWLWTRNTKDE